VRGAQHQLHRRGGLVVRNREQPGRTAGDDGDCVGVGLAAGHAVNESRGPVGGLDPAGGSERA
jgi:hypothetical protein